MHKRIHHGEYERRINEAGRGWFEFVCWDGEFKNAHSKAVCKCLIDGHMWSAKASNLTISLTGCPMCHGNAKLTEKSCIEMVNCAGDGRFYFHGFAEEFHGKRTKIACKCAVDGFEWVTKIDHIVSSGSACPKCAIGGYNPGKPGTLYALRSRCGTMVKIGISNDYKRRISRLRRATPFEFDCIKTVHSIDGAIISALEREILSMLTPVEFSDKFEGHTEWRMWDGMAIDWMNANEKIQQS